MLYPNSFSFPFFHGRIMRKMRGVLGMLLLAQWGLCADFPGGGAQSLDGYVARVPPDEPHVEILHPADGQTVFAEWQVLCFTCSARSPCHAASVKITRPALALCECRRVIATQCAVLYSIFCDPRHGHSRDCTPACAHAGHANRIGEQLQAPHRW